MLSKQTGFNQDSVISKMTGKNQDLMLQIFSNRTNSKQENIRIPYRPKKGFKNITWTRDQGSGSGHFSSSTKAAGIRGAMYYL